MVRNGLETSRPPGLGVFFVTGRLGALAKERTMPTEYESPSESIQLPDAESPVVVWQSGICQFPGDLSVAAIFPGAFNPIHEGHRRLSEAASVFLGCSVLFELSIDNVDKPTLSAAEVHRRLQQMADCRVLLTKAALFSEKARLFPGAWFVVGFDTAERILDPKYYGVNRQSRDQSLQELYAKDVKFLVAGRVAADRQLADFRTSSQLSASHSFKEMFVELPETCFRVDTSSTAIRQSERVPRND